MQVNAPLAAPLVLQFLIGLAIVGAFNCIGVLIVDLYPMSPATVTAANNLVRCLMGAWGTAVIIPMIERLGRGWAFTVIAALPLVFSPILWVLLIKGGQWREERRLRVEKHEAEKKARESATDVETHDEEK